MAPVDEGPFGDAEFGGHAGKAEAAGAAFDEFLDGLAVSSGIVHDVFAPMIPEGVGQPLSM